MKAIIWTRYGSPDSLELQEIETPVPKDNEVLIKIHATTVTAGDCEIRNLKLLWLYRIPVRLYIGWKKPERIKILGQEFSGEIAAIGKSVTLFKEGDEVFGTTGFSMGAYGQYMTLPEQSQEQAIAIKPSNITHQEAAGFPVGGFEALHFLKQAHLSKGKRILINGAGGSIGSIAIQLAKFYSAKITAVDSEDKHPLMKSLGADDVIDYIKEDYTKSKETYDVILDIVGNSSFSGSIKTLDKNGFYLIANPGLFQGIRGFFTSRFTSKKVIVGTAQHTVKDLKHLKELIEEEKLKAVIDKTYPLEKVSEAHAYVETGKKKGNVVIVVDHD